MKKLMVIAIVGLFAVTTAFAQGPRPGGGGRGPGGGDRGPAPGRVEHHHHGVSDDLAKAGAIVGIVRDSLGILGVGSPRVVVPPPPPRPKVIVREPAPVIIRTTPVVTTPVVQEVVVEKPIVVEKVVTPEVKKIEPVLLGDKIYYMITFSDGTVKTIKAE